MRTSWVHGSFSMIGTSMIRDAIVRSSDSDPTSPSMRCSSRTRSRGCSRSGSTRTMYDAFDGAISSTPGMASSARRRVIASDVKCTGRLIAAESST